MAVTYTQQLLDQVTAYAGQSLNDRRSAAGLAELARLYSAITGQPVGTCRQCQYSDYLAALSNYSRAATRFLHPETMPDSKYALAAGLENEQIVHDSYGKVVTAENLEDKDVEFFQKQGLGNMFVLKSKKEAPAVAGDTSEKGSEPSAAEKKAGEATAKAQKEATDAKLALKAEKEAHKATHKELADTKKLLADSEQKLTEVSQRLADATKATGESEADAK